MKNKTYLVMLPIVAAVLTACGGGGGDTGGAAKTVVGADPAPPVNAAPAAPTLASPAAGTPVPQNSTPGATQPPSNSGTSTPPVVTPPVVTPPVVTPPVVTPPVVTPPVVTPPVTTGPTHVSGHITTNAEWTANGSPYILDGDTTVDYNATLTIDAGVVVKGDGVRYLNIAGGLAVNGTAAANDEFDQVNLNSIGFAVDDANGSPTSASHPSAIDINFTHFVGGSILPSALRSTPGYTAFNLRDSVLTNLTDTIYLWYPTNASDIERNAFVGGYGILFGTLWTKPVIKNNLFQDWDEINPQTGYFALATFATYGDTQGVKGDGVAVISGNTFANTDRVATRITAVDGAMVASGNYWGTAVDAAIVAMTYDGHNDCTLYRSGTPILIDHTSPLTGPAAATPVAGTPTPLATPGTTSATMMTCPAPVAPASGASAPAATSGGGASAPVAASGSGASAPAAASDSGASAPVAASGTGASAPVGASA